ASCSPPRFLYGTWLAHYGCNTDLVPIQHFNRPLDAPREQSIPHGGLQAQFPALKLQGRIRFHTLEELGINHLAVSACRRLLDQGGKLRHSRHKDTHPWCGIQASKREVLLKKNGLACPDIVNTLNQSASGARCVFLLHGRLYGQV